MTSGLSARCPNDGANDPAMSGATAVTYLSANGHRLPIAYRSDEPQLAYALGNKGFAGVAIGRRAAPKKGRIGVPVMMDSILQDFRYALRQLQKSPGFVVVAIFTLALGIGATTSIFSLADAVLLRPLQFANQDRLVEIYEDASAIGFPKNTPAPGNFGEWKQRNHTFADLAATRNTAFNLTGGGNPEKVDGTRVTANLFKMLGVMPLLGRDFLPEEDKPGAAKVVIIGASLWRQQYGADPNVIGQNVTLNYESYRIVGVMPGGFTFPERAQLWVPMAFTPADLQTRNSHYLHVYGLIKNGVSFQTAFEDLRTIAKQLGAEYPETNTNVGVRMETMRDQLVGDLRLALVLLLAGVACVLLIACGNVAGLMMARAAARNREIAVRAALGASRGRLIRQAVAESLVLSVAGSGLGLLFTSFALPFLSRLVPLAMQAWTKPALDWRLALFTCAIGIGSALFFGLLGFAPVRIDLQTALQQGGRGISGTRHPLRRVLVMAQIALALPLLVGSGLMVQTVYKLSHVDLGFNPDQVLTLRTPLATSVGSPYSSADARHRFFEQVVQRIEQLPGVVSAGFTSYLPLANRGGTASFVVEGQPPQRPGEFNDANIRIVTPDFLKAMQVKLVSGRLLDARDTSAAPNAVVVTQAVVEKYLRSNNPVGMRIHFLDDDPNAKPIWFTVVGVIGDIRQAGLHIDPRPEMYFSEPQLASIADFENFYTPRDLAVRVHGKPSSFTEAVRKAIWDVDPQQPISNVQPMQQWVDDELASRDMQLKLFASFAVVSVILAAVGLYGLLAFTVSQRTRETGVRMALGAQTGDILRLYLSEGGRIVLIGVAIGIGASVITQRAMRALLFGVNDSGAIALSIGIVVLVTAGIAAVYLPARRAAAVEPMEALRSE